MRALVILAISAAPAMAGLSVDNCRIEVPSMFPEVATCDVANYGERAISRLSYTAEFGSPDRATPWSVHSGEAHVPGGIEPGETVSVNFYGGMNAIHATRPTVTVDVTP